jgi:hypothetical protein
MSGELAPVTLRADDAIELAEMLEFLIAWLDATDQRLDLELLRHTVGSYHRDELLADLARFAFLLGGAGDRFLDGAAP